MYTSFFHHLLQSLRSWLRPYGHRRHHTQKRPKHRHPAMIPAETNTEPLDRARQNEPHHGAKPEKHEHRSQHAETASPSPRYVDLHKRLLDYLDQRYELRYNVLTEEAECRPRGENGPFRTIDERMFNTLTIGAVDEGTGAWAVDIRRVLRSDLVATFHPLQAYLAGLPAWDGTDRVALLAERVSHDVVWKRGFAVWLRALVAQWMGLERITANALVPLIVSREQGMRKSTFVRTLMPPELMAYFTDKFDLLEPTNIEQRITRLGLISLDEFDRYTPRQTAALKNLLQLKRVNIRRAYRQHLVETPRLASFIATCNELEVLKDLTGSRRFLCVEVKTPIDCSPIDHAQLFAQLKAETMRGDATYLDRREEQHMQLHNRAFVLVSPAAEVFWKMFRLPEKNEEAPLHSATELFLCLQAKYPAALRGLTAVGFGRVLRGLGATCVHTKTGNCYRVVRR